MRKSILLGLPSLALIGAAAHAAVDAAAVEDAPPSVAQPSTAPDPAAPPEVVYKMFLSTLASVEAQDYNSYLHALGSAFRVDVASAAPADLQTLEAYGSALLDQHAALETEEGEIRWHLLCADGLRPRSPGELVTSARRIDREVGHARRSHLELSISEMPDELRGAFEHFLIGFGQSVSFSVMDPAIPAEASVSIDDYVAEVCDLIDAANRNADVNVNGGAR
ncbi:MAG: hypothetical protein AAGD86_14475 [Pseudomonadota bacterium]